MCGITGVISDSNAPFKAFIGLKKLEYRGYDSWGIAFKSCDGIEVYKAVGKIITPEKGTLNHNSYASIAHTRWATHGKVTVENAHPHTSNDKSIAIVHNGIMENYQEVKQQLLKKGFTFYSETDTEVLANLIQLKVSEKKNFAEGVRAALLEVEGSYAILALHKDTYEMVAAKNGSPLALGIGNKELFAASDVAAFLPYTKTAVYLNDFEMAVLGNDLKVLDIKTGKELQYRKKQILWTVEQAEKGNYAHFMRKEIDEQPFTIKKSIEQEKGKVEKVAELIKKAKGVFFVGCGTSYHSCISSSYLFSGIAKMHVNVVLASEFRNYKEFLKPETLVIAVSQSGETADVIDAIKTAKSKGSKVVAIVNVMDSTVMRLSDDCLMMNAGPEICVLSTKSYTSQLSILSLLAYAVAGRLNEGKQLIEEASKKADETIRRNEPIAKEIAKKFSNAKDFFLIGRDLAFPTALEGALKIKEVSYIHAEGFAGGELKHGTIALIEDGVPCIVLCTDETRPLIISNATEVKSRGGAIIGVDSKEDSIFDYFFRVDELGSANPILMILPIQLLAYHLALERNCDPDKPRNLAKSVTVK